MRSLDPALHRSSILATYGALQEVDPMRTNYYRDMAAGLVVEEALTSATSSTPCSTSLLDLSLGEVGVSRTQAAKYAHYLAAFDTVRFQGD